MFHLHIEPLFEFVEFLAKGDGVPIFAALDQQKRTLIAAVGEGPQHAHHRSDPDASGHKDAARCLVTRV